MRELTLCLAWALLALMTSCASHKGMTEALHAKHKEALPAQIALNESQWGRLQELGVTETTELRLEFFYVSAGEDSALALGEFLSNTTDYELTVEERETSTWVVTGSTQETRIHLDLLNRWVDWMITTGLVHQSRFGGWETARLRETSG